jgi:large subunit ribosomal protein L25
VESLRRQGKLPGVIYGHNFDSQPITLDLKEVTNTLNRLSSSSIVTVNLEGKEHSALVREKQRDYIKNVLIHVDFQTVSLTEKLRTEVRIELVGESPAVKDMNALVVSGIDEVEVECFPQDLPEHITVDISKLVNIGDAIYLKDIPLLENVNFITGPDELIAVITAVKEEVVEEVVPVEGVEAEVEPEVIEKGKKEEEGEEALAKAEGKPEMKGKPEVKGKTE